MKSFIVHFYTITMLSLTIWLFYINIKLFWKRLLYDEQTQKDKKESEERHIKEKDLMFDMLSKYHFYKKNGKWMYKTDENKKSQIDFTTKDLCIKYAFRMYKLEEQRNKSYVLLKGKRK